jgi:hypothetical protein
VGVTMRHGKEPRQQTFADLVQEATWSETDASRSGQYAPRPGGFNAAGEFFDPDGIKLRLVAEGATEDEAQALIEAGAAVVAKGAGVAAPMATARRSGSPMTNCATSAGAWRPGILDATAPLPGSTSGRMTTARLCSLTGTCPGATRSCSNRPLLPRWH